MGKEKITLLQMSKFLIVSQLLASFIKEDVYVGLEIINEMGMEEYERDFANRMHICDVRVAGLYAQLAEDRYIHWGGVTGGIRFHIRDVGLMYITPTGIEGLKDYINKHY